MDDETYVPYDYKQILWKEFWNDIPGVKIPANSKVKRKEKFPRKFLIWQAISQDRSISKPFITKQNLNGKIYLKDILQSPFLKIFNSQREKGKLLFWPDLASSHYCKTVQVYFKDKNIEYVPKVDNPPNIPQCQLIEKFWALCKMEYHRRKNLSNLAAFKREWLKISKFIAQKHGKNLFRNLHLIGDHGINAAKWIY